MDKKRQLERRSEKNQLVRELVEKAKKVCFSFFGEEYTYSSAEAVEELGLDEDLVDHLIKDYVAQIIKSVVMFEEYIYALQEAQDAKKELDYTPLRDLAHKNLGVARNLRIKDAEILLKDLMHEDDLQHLFKCIEVLRACAIRLKPMHAYHTIKLIEIKSTF